jgi:hypothetical protein
MPSPSFSSPQEDWDSTSFQLDDRELMSGDYINQKEKPDRNREFLGWNVVCYNLRACRVQPSGCDKNNSTSLSFSSKIH